jgi:hypothetical protein
MEGLAGFAILFFWVLAGCVLFMVIDINTRSNYIVDLESRAVKRRRMGIS